MKEMSTEQLIETIMIRPTVTLIPTNQHTGLTSEYSFKPLSNLIYMRDQQITTVKGIVLGCLKTPQRRLETAVMHFAFSKLGAPHTRAPAPPARRGAHLHAAARPRRARHRGPHRQQRGRAGRRAGVPRGRRLLPRRRGPRAARHRPAHQLQRGAAAHGQGPARHAALRRGSRRARPEPGPHAPRLRVQHPQRQLLPHAGDHHGQRERPAAARGCVGAQARCEGRLGQVHADKGQDRHRVRVVHAGARARLRARCLGACVPGHTNCTTAPPLCTSGGVSPDGSQTNAIRCRISCRFVAG